MFRFLEKIDNSTWGAIFRVVLAPLWLLLEYIMYFKIWKKTIIPEMITSDKIFKFLDENEFGYTDGYFVKADLIDENEYFVDMPINNVKQYITKEFVESFSKLLSEESNMNIEEYITLRVICEYYVSEVNETGDFRHDRIFKVYLTYCRRWWLNLARKYTYIWLTIISAIIISGLIYVINFYK